MLTKDMIIKFNKLCLHTISMVKIDDYWNRIKSYDGEFPNKFWVYYTNDYWVDCVGCGWGGDEYGIDLHWDFEWYGSKPFDTYQEAYKLAQRLKKHNLHTTNKTLKPARDEINTIEIDDRVYTKHHEGRPIYTCGMMYIMDSRKWEKFECDDFDRYKEFMKNLKK